MDAATDVQAKADFRVTCNCYIRRAQRNALRLRLAGNCGSIPNVIGHHSCARNPMFKVLAWVVGILLLIGLLVVVGVFDLIF